MKTLIVDDNFEVVSHTCSLLEQNEFNAMPATSAKRALGIAFHKHPDLIIYDMLMPEMNGFEFCEILMLNPATHGIPVVLITRNGYEPDDNQLRLSGVIDIIKKPIDEKEFILKMNEFHKYINETKKREKKENLKFSK
jgi:CheY-like chemotaxis protein